MNEFKNEVHLSGSLIKDADIRYTPKGKCVATLTILTKHETFSEFHRVVLWEALAERVNKLRKGDWVRIVGRLATRSWDDKATGQKRYMTETIAFQLVIPDEESAPARESPRGGTASARAILSHSTAATNVHGVDITDADIPF